MNAHACTFLAVIVIYLSWLFVFPAYAKHDISGNIAYIVLCMYNRLIVDTKLKMNSMH
jgi:hypothetical protein